MSAANRRKGLNFEREVAKKLRHLFPKAQRNLEYQINDANGVDLEHTGKLLIQCKRSGKSISMNKIKEIQVSDGIHCLVSKVDREKEMITLYFDDFIKILEDIGIVYEGNENEMA